MNFTVAGLLQQTPNQNEGIYQWSVAHTKWSMMIMICYLVLRGSTGSGATKGTGARLCLAASRSAIHYNTPLYY
jgi:hypothetical protein